MAKAGGGNSTALAIQTSGLVKRFGQRAAVAGTDLAVPRGSVFGFLGPNGSGKTTTIRMLLGLVSPDQGSITVLGKDLPRELATVLPDVGALVEGPGFYPFLSGEANLKRLDSADRHAEAATRNARVGAALERVGLAHAAGKKVRAYSLGMKQRLGLANALLRERALLVLDEPTNGLDPQGTREVRHLVGSLAADGATVFVSSHLLAEVEQMCTHVGIMSAGRLVAQGTLEELRSAGQSTVTVKTPDVDLAVRVLAHLGLVPGTALPGGTVPGGTLPGGTVMATGMDGIAPEVISAALVRDGVRVRGFSVENASLEERYVALTGAGFDVVG